MRWLIKIVLLIFIGVLLIFGVFWYRATLGGKYKLIADPSIVAGQEPELPPISQEQQVRLSNAVSKCSLAEVDGILSSGVDVNSRLELENGTALHVAVNNVDLCNGPEMVKYLLEKGANTELRDGHGDTPLMRAIGSEGMETVRVLLDYNASLLTSNYYGRTPIARAASVGDLDLLTMVLRRNVPVDYRAKDQWGRYGWTALMLASASNGRQAPEVVKFLLDNGADITIKDYFGKTALDLAKEVGNKDVLDVYKKRISAN